MQGRILKGIGGFYYVEASNRIFESKASGLFRLNEEKPTVGDYVEIQINDDDTAYITKIFPRKNIFLRPPVSNIDGVFIIMSGKNPDFNDWLVDRMILLSRYNGMEPNIIINKNDLDQIENQLISSDYKEAGFRTFSTSYKDENSLEEFKNYISEKTSLFMGPSGVGKSSLISYITGKELETGAISLKTSRGKHTTRHVELLHYDLASYIIDTPGFSSLSLDFIGDIQELEGLYYEYHNKNCKFNDCLHINEPKCGVKKALKEGELKEFRYKNYLSFHNEIKNRR